MIPGILAALEALQLEQSSGEQCALGMPEYVRWAAVP